MSQKTDTGAPSPNRATEADPLPEASGRGLFPPTRWTLVQDMRDPASTKRATRALNELCLAPVSLDREWAEGRFPIEPATHTSPDVLFDRQWALTVLAHVMTQLKAHYEATGKAAVFDGLKSTISPEGGKRALAEIAAELGISEGAAKVAAHRLRQRYRRILEETIAETVGSEEAVREEIRHLLGAFGD